MTQPLSLRERVVRLDRQLERMGYELARAHRYSAQDPGAALNKARTVLERIVRDQFERRVGQPPGRRSLAQLLTHHDLRREIKPRVLAWMQTVQQLGNLGSHGQTVVGEDARLSLEALCNLVDWYLEDIGSASDEQPATATPFPAALSSPVPAASMSRPIDNGHAAQLTGEGPATSAVEPDGRPPARRRTRRGRLWGVLIAFVMLAVLFWVVFGALLLLPKTDWWQAQIELPRQMKTLERRGHGHLSYALRRRLDHKKPTFRLTPAQGLSATSALLEVVDRLPRTSPQLAQLMPQTALELARSVGQRGVHAAEAERMAAFLVDFMVQQRLGNRAGFDWDMSVVIGRDFAARGDAGRPVARPSYAQDWAANGVPDLKSAARLRTYLERTVRLPYFGKNYRPGEAGP